MAGPLERGVYLASRSPRRRELLAQIGVRFHLLLFRARPGQDVEVDETPLAGEAADVLIRLSSLTLPHALAQVILLEQIYRAATLLTGHPYHRA